MASQTQPSPIFSAWERLVRNVRADGTLAPEVEEEWAALWQRHVVGDRLSQMDVFDAGLLCTLGWELAMQRRDFEAALTRAIRCFDHPGWAQVDESLYEWLLKGVAEARWRLGDEAGAVDNCRRLLHLKRPHNTLPQLYVHNCLSVFSRERSAAECAPSEFAGLTAELVRECQGCVGLAKSITPGTATFGQLATVLEQSYPE
jgi:hypothetical protein